VDWNSDGVHDLLVGNAVGNIIVFLNSGTKKEPLLTKGVYVHLGDVLLDAGIRTAPEAADWNGDGTMDLLVGSMDGRIKVYLNKGSERAPVFDSYSFLQIGGRDFDAGSRSAPRVHDWNNDGRKDLLVGEFEGSVYYLQNTGSDSTPSFTKAGKLYLRNGDVLRYPSQQGFPRSRVYVSDWNDDGFYDLLVGGADGKIMLYMASPESTGSVKYFLNTNLNQIIETARKLYLYSREKAGVLKRSVLDSRRQSDPLQSPQGK